MYAQACFREERLPVLQAAIREIGLAALVTAGPSGLEATHLPFFLEAEEGPFGTLYGHMARANPHWGHLAEATESLAIFQGPHAYITPSWYESKGQTGKVVPTWNYIAVHAHGSLDIVDDPAFARTVVEKQTRFHEGGRPHPWAVADAPEDYIQALLKAIIPVRLTIARLEGAWKLSQNKTPEDRAGVKRGLSADAVGQTAAVAQGMA